MWQPHGVYLFSPAEPLRSVSLSSENAVLTDTVSSFSKRIMRIYSIKVETVSFFREHSYLLCFDGDIFCAPLNISALARAASVDHLQLGRSFCIILPQYARG
jgi:hypothetical protein